MRTFDSPYGKILLTKERLRHMLTFHPEVRTCLRHFTLALRAPEHTAASIHDPDVVICYRFLPRRKKHLAIVVHTEKRFIVTAYLARKPKHDTL